jgi:hypothetical protein
VLEAVGSLLPWRYVFRPHKRLKMSDRYYRRSHVFRLHNHCRRPQAMHTPR